MNKNFFSIVLLGGLLSSSVANLEAQISSNDILYGAGFGALSRLISYAGVKSGSFSKGQGVGLGALISLVLIAGTSDESGAVSWNTVAKRTALAAAIQTISLLFVEAADKKPARRASH